MTPSEIQSITESMARRAPQWRSRLVIAAVVAAVSFPLTSPVFAATWLGVYALLQVIERGLVPDGPWARRLGQGRYIKAALALAFFNNVVFSAYGVAEIFSGTMLGLACGMLVVGGVVVNAVMLSPGSRSMVIVALLPQTIYLTALPYAALRMDLSVFAVTQLTFAAVMLVLAGLSIRTQVSRLFAQTQAARTQADEANQAKSQFLATMSHEIRTPLNGVLGMAQAMAADELPDRQRDRLSVISRSGQSMLQILGDVLDLAKVEAGRLELETVDFDLETLVKDSQGGFAALAEAKGLTLVTDIDPSAAGWWRGDPTRLRQILSNLYSNAVKFTDTGQITLTASAGPSGLSITVADTGPGVSEEQLTRLFRQFSQADAAVTRIYGGTGLGLSICAELTQLMGGQIQARRLAPHGLAFDLTVPLERAAAPESSPSAQCTAPIPSLDGHWLRVLAADDHSVNRQVLGILLGQLGIEAVFVENGAQAIEAWREGDWDIILMDVQMPVLDGPSAAAQIRSEEAITGRPRTPIIALTADVMAHQTETYLARGMDRAVGKPIEIGALIAAIQASLADTSGAQMSLSRQA